MAHGRLTVSRAEGRTQTYLVENTNITDGMSNSRLVS
jgi:hypothetical protein